MDGDGRPDLRRQRLRRGLRRTLHLGPAALRRQPRADVLAEGAFRRRRSPTLIETYVRAYLDQVRWFVDADDDAAFSLNLETARGRGARRRCGRPGCRRGPRCSTASPSSTTADRRFRNAPGVTPARRRRARRRSWRPSTGYLETIPQTPSGSAESPTTSRTSSAKTGFGIGSAGLPAYTVLIEGFNQALDNDVVLSMKQGNVAAPEPGGRRRRRARVLHSTTATAPRSRSGRCRPTPTRCSARPTSTASASWSARSRRTTPISTGASSPSRTRSGRGHRATRPGDRQGALRQRRRQRPVAGRLPDRGRDRRGDRRPRRRIRRRHVSTFGLEYAVVVRDDHRHFVEAFREGRIPGVTST